MRCWVCLCDSCERLSKTDAVSCTSGILRNRANFPAEELCVESAVFRSTNYG